MAKLALKKCPNCGEVKCSCRPSERAMASAPKYKVKLPSVELIEVGSALWFARALAAAHGHDVRGPAGQDLLAAGVRMSEADRRTLVRLMAPATPGIS